MKQQLNEFIKVADTAFALRLLRLMTMPVEKTGAYKAGLIDKEYKLVKDKKECNKCCRAVLETNKNNVIKSDGKNILFNKICELYVQTYA